MKTNGLRTEPASKDIPPLRKIRGRVHTEQSSRSDLGLAVLVMGLLFLSDGMDYVVKRLNISRVILSASLVVSCKML